MNGCRAIASAKDYESPNLRQITFSDVIFLFKWYHVWCVIKWFSNIDFLSYIFALIYPDSKDVIHVIKVISQNIIYHHLEFLLQNITNMCPIMVQWASKSDVLWWDFHGHVHFECIMVKGQFQRGLLTVCTWIWRLLHMKGLWWCSLPRRFPEILQEKFYNDLSISSHFCIINIYAKIVIYSLTFAYCRGKHLFFIKSNENGCVLCYQLQGQNFDICCVFQLHETNLIGTLLSWATKKGFELNITHCVCDNATFLAAMHR